MMIGVFMSYLSLWICGEGEFAAQFLCQFGMKVNFCRLNCCFMNVPFQAMNRTAHHLKLLVIVRGQSFISFPLHFADACLDSCLVDTYDLVVLMLQAEGFGDCYD